MSTKTPKPTEDSQHFFGTSTDIGLFSIILHLRIVWELLEFTQEEYQWVFSKKILRKIGRSFYLSVDSHFLKVNVLSEWERREGFCNNLHFYVEEYLYWANKCNATTPTPTTPHRPGSRGTPPQNLGAEKRGNVSRALPSTCTYDPNRYKLLTQLPPKTLDNMK